MNPNEIEVGLPVMHGSYLGTRFIPSSIEGIVTKISKSVTYENGRKQYTIEFGKRKPYYSQLKIINYYATVAITDGSLIDINIENLCRRR